MKAMYYTTSEIKRIFGWQSNTTVSRKRESGFLPPPDLTGRPNKWLKSKIDAIINDTDSNTKSDPI